jgi:hypothetical protein
MWKYESFGKIDKWIEMHANWQAGKEANGHSYTQLNKGAG